MTSHSVKKHLHCFENRLDILLAVLMKLAKCLEVGIHKVRTAVGVVVHLSRVNGVIHQFTSPGPVNLCGGSH